MLVVKRWRDLILISLERDQLVVARGELGDLLLDGGQFVKVCLNALLGDLYIFLNTLLDIEENLSRFDQRLLVDTGEG
jgi:hypothetical protein